jgi:hypothetical protein
MFKGGYVLPSSVRKSQKLSTVKMAGLLREQQFVKLINLEVRMAQRQAPQHSA